MPKVVSLFQKLSTTLVLTALAEEIVQPIIEEAMMDSENPEDCWIDSAFTAEQYAIWSTSYNYFLRCTPQQALDAGRIKDVKEAVEIFIKGLY